MAGHRDLELCAMLHYHWQMCVYFRTGGCNNFSTSYGGSKRGGGYEIVVLISPPRWSIVEI
jgi:hypothetical protein